MEPPGRDVHGLGDVAAAVGQEGFLALWRVRILELGVGTQVLEKGLEVAVEADLGLDRLHLAAQAGNLSQAGFVDPVGGVVRRVVEAQHGLVIGGPVRQRPDAVVAILALADLGDGGQKDLIAGLERAGQGGAGIADDLDLFALGDVERIHLGLDVRPQGRRLCIVERRAGDDAATRRQIGRIGQGRRGKSRLGPGAEIGGDLGHHPLGGGQARDIGAGVLDRIDAVLVHQHDRQAAHDAAAFGDQVLVVAILEQLLLLGQAIGEQAQRQPTLFGQIGTGEARQDVGGLALGQGELIGGTLGRIVVQLAIAFLQAQPGQGFGRGAGRLHKGGVQCLQQGRVRAGHRRSGP